MQGRGVLGFGANSNLCLEGLCAHMATHLWGSFTQMPNALLWVSVVEKRGGCTVKLHDHTLKENAMELK